MYKDGPYANDVTLMDAVHTLIHEHYLQRVQQVYSLHIVEYPPLLITHTHTQFTILPPLNHPPAPLITGAPFTKSPVCPASLRHRRSFDYTRSRHCERRRTLRETLPPAQGV